MGVPATELSDLHMIVMGTIMHHASPTPRPPGGGDHDRTVRSALLSGSSRAPQGSAGADLRARDVHYRRTYSPAPGSAALAADRLPIVHAHGTIGERPCRPSRCGPTCESASVGRRGGAIHACERGDRAAALEGALYRRRPTRGHTGRYTQQLPGTAVRIVRQRIHAGGLHVTAPPSRSPAAALTPSGGW